MNYDKIIVIKKETELEGLLNRYNTTSQVKFYLESRGHSYDFFKEAHDIYKKSLKTVQTEIPPNMRTQVVDKDNLGTFQFGDHDLVVTVGDDGLLVNVAKYVGLQPIISVNPDKNRFDGVLSTCSAETFKGTLKNVLDGNPRYSKLTMAEAKFDDGQVMYALNDLFVGRCNHISARYEIEYQKKKERHSSSGIIITTGTGSTGWIKSIAESARSFAGRRTKLDDLIPFTKEEDYLVFTVREPFPSKITGTEITFGKITKDSPLQIYSQMPEEGVIFSDGIISDYLEFNAGRTATILPSDKKINLVNARSY